MIELLPKPKTEVVRRQVLVIHCDHLVTYEETQKIMDRVRKEMKDGLVFLPYYLTATTVDMDCMAVMEQEDE